MSHGVECEIEQMKKQRFETILRYKKQNGATVILKQNKHIQLST